MTIRSVDGYFVIAHSVNDSLRRAENGDFSDGEAGQGGH